MFESRSTRSTRFPGVLRLTHLASLFLLVAAAAPLAAQGRITSPKEFFGFNIGDDYNLATYTQFQAYWKKIDAESNRMVVEEIGKTAEGRPQLMAIITAPENFKNLARYKQISQRLALAEGLTDEQAKAMAGLLVNSGPEALLKALEKAKSIGKITI